MKKKGCCDGIDSIIVTLASRRGWCGLVSLLRGPHNDILATLSPFWRISDIIISCQAGDFIPAQIRVRICRPAPLDQGDLRWCERLVDVSRSEAYGMYLVEEDMCHAISRIDRSHTAKVSLGCFEKTFGSFIVFPTVRILGHVQADRSSINVKDRVILVWKRRKISGNRM